MINVINGDLQSALNSAAVGEVVVLTSDITLTNRITVSNISTIDLNGFTITGNISDSYGAIYVSTKGVLTIKDGSVGQTGHIINTIGMAIGNYGVVEIYGGTFIGNYALYNFYYNNSIYGTSTIYGGVFKASDSLAIANCGYLNVKGGYIETIDTTNILDISGGTIESLYVGVADYDPEKQSTSISGGRIVSLDVDDDTSNEIVISGGTFDVAVDNKYLANDVKFVYNNSTGVYEAVVRQGFKVIATSSSRISELAIKDQQLIFIQDLGRIAFDFKGKRVFYNQIIELESEQDRISLESPVNGKYYFVIEKAVFWRYYNGWKQISSSPDEILFIGTEMPELGQPKTLYVDKANREISVWDDAEDTYLKVSNYTDSISAGDVLALF